MSALHRWFNLAGVLLPFLGFVAAVVLLWNTLVDWSDLAVMLIMYVISGYGVTLGFHRLLTHRSFQTFKPVEYTLAILGSIAVQGPGDVVGRRPSQAPRAHRQGGRPAHAARPRQRVQGRDRRALVRAHGLAVRGLRHVRARALREGPLRGPRHARHPPHVRPVGAGRAADAVRPRLPDRRHARRRADRGAVGRPGADLRAPPRHVVDQLGLPLLRDAPLHGRGPLDERVLARAALVRRELAPQPPRVPALRRSTGCAGGRSTRRPG